MQIWGFIDIHPRRMKICITNINIWKFILELTLAKMWNVHQSVNGWTNCRISIKQNTTQLYNSELLIYAATWSNLKIIMVDKRESKDTCYVIPHIWKYRKCKLICRSESRLILPWQRKGGSERIGSPKHKRKHFRMTESFIILVLQV